MLCLLMLGRLKEEALLHPRIQNISMNEQRLMASTAHGN
jgi:hypothetical protein